jgi:hypothetical protein
MLRIVRTITGLLIAGAAAGCAHNATSPAQNCRIEPGWLDSSNGCMARSGYDDCYKVCPDGTRTRLIGGDPSLPK